MCFPARRRSCSTAANAALSSTTVPWSWLRDSQRAVKLAVRFKKKKKKKGSNAVRVIYGWRRTSLSLRRKQIKSPLYNFMSTSESGLFIKSQVLTPPICLTPSLSGQHSHCLPLWAYKSLQEIPHVSRSYLYRSLLCHITPCKYAPRLNLIFLSIYLFFL